MHILLLQDQPEIRARFVFALECSLNAKVTEAETAEEAIAVIRNKDKPVDVIVYDYSGAPLKGFRQITSITSYLPWVFVVGDPKAKPTITGVSRIYPVFRGNLLEDTMAAIQHVQQGGSLRAKSAKEEEPSEAGDASGYVRIRTKLLLNVAPLQGDIYIKLSDLHYVKLFRQGDVFDREDLEKYTIRKGVGYLFIKEAQTKEFVEKVKEELKRLLALASLTVAEASRSNVAVYETIQELTKRVGFTPEVQDLAKTQVLMTVQMVNKNPRLANLLASLKDSEGKYISTHSTLTGYLACGIASQMQWGSEMTYFKLNLAAMLHDITLTNEDLARVGSLQELEEAGARFTEAEKAEYKNHPFKASEVAKRFNEVPPDVDTIILQHHERPDGTGFPRSLNHTYIAPLAAVFIVAHDMALYTLDAGDKFRMDDFLAKYRTVYKSTQFRKIMQALESVTDL